MRRLTFVLLASLLLAPHQSDAADAPAQLFPFVLPWDDATESATDVSGWLHRPAGKFGPVRAGDDGHLYAGKERVRFFGVNLCFGANFPAKKDADKVAGRMAKFGVNVVRFHHMDMFAYPRGIRARGAQATGDLDPEALDRLDYLTSRLKKHGVYSNLNLLVSRPFNAADGLPADIERVDWKERHVVGFFHKPVLELQKDYARKLLTHRNPYTGLNYAEDPAVAFVEINNENGLIQGWMGNQVDQLPDIFLADLKRQWNRWLQQRHGSTAKLRQAWGVKDVPVGAELLANADFARGAEGWRLERHGGAQAAAQVGDEGPPKLPGAKSLRLQVTRPGAEGWHVQFNQPGLRVRAEQPYTLTFWAKADQPLTAGVQLGQAHEPWQALGFSTDVKLTPEWKSFRFVVQPNANDANARLNFSNLGGRAATVWLAGVSLKPGGSVGLSARERLEDGSVGLVAHNRFGQYPAEGQRDWLRFLWETEDAYWRAMRRYLTDDLKVRGVVVGTIVGCSTPNLMARFGTVDTHSYWQHPHFPHRPWDPEDWVVHNRTMVNEAGGTLPGLALRRVRGKPHAVSEYNHSAPNTYGSEGFLLLAAYGALQDWDALYAFDYSSRDQWDARRIEGFFDIDRHPTKMATLPAAVALFTRGDVRPAREEVVAVLDKDREIDALRKTWAWELVHAGHAGMPREAALVHRVAIVTHGRPAAAERPAGPRYAADTGELLWDLTDKRRGVVTIDTPKSKG